MAKPQPIIEDWAQRQVREHAENKAKLDAASAMLAALEEVILINEESAGDCRRRMGTRRGNSIVTARAAIAAAKAAGIRTEG